MLVGLCAALLAAFVFGGSSILQALGSRRAGDEQGLSLGTTGRLLREPAFLGALVLNLVGFLLHLVAVRALPLFLAQAGIAASLAVTALLAVRIFKDRLTATEWSAVAAVCVGLALLTAAAGETGSQRAGSTLSVALFVVAGVMVMVGVVAARAEGATSAATLSLLAGAGFAATAVAARVLPALTPGDLVRTPAAYALPLSGALAFLLYSLALQRSSVTVATAPMIIVQTAAPAVVGVLLLGDAVRGGWAAGAVVGFVLTAAGATALVRFEGVREQVDDTR